VHNSKDNKVETIRSIHNQRMSSRIRLSTRQTHQNHPCEAKGCGKAQGGKTANEYSIRR